MNTKIWRKDREIMLIVNSTGSKFLSLMDRQRTFSEAVNETFDPKVSFFADMNFSDPSNLALVFEFEDRFLQSATYALSLWSRDLISFDLNPKMTGQIEASSEVISKIVGQDRPISVSSVLDQLYLKYNKDYPKIYSAFIHEQGTIFSLFPKDMLLPVFKGGEEIFEGNDWFLIRSFPNMLSDMSNPAS